MYLAGCGVYFSFNFHCERALLLTFSIGIVQLMSWLLVPMTSLSIPSHRVFHACIVGCVSKLCASRLAVLYVSLIYGVQLFILNLKHINVVVCNFYF